MLVGATRVRQWLTLMAVADLAGDEHHAAAVLVQARFCQEIATRQGLPAAAAYAVGLLDAVCELTGDGRTSLTRQVPLAPELAAALTSRRGPLGRVLAAATAYHHRSPPQAADPDLAPAYLAALAWTSDLTRTAVQT